MKLTKVDKKILDYANNNEAKLGFTSLLMSHQKSVCLSTPCKKPVKTWQAKVSSCGAISNTQAFVQQQERNTRNTSG